VAQAEPQICKYEVLSSNYSPTPQKKFFLGKEIIQLRSNGNFMITVSVISLGLGM
jgi:hypothetical protein